MMRTSFSFLTLLLTLVAQACAQSAGTQTQQQQPQQKAASAPAGAGAPADQSAPANADHSPPPMKPVPKLTAEEMEVFLQSAKIVKTEKLNTGTTGTARVTLSDGKLTHDAHVQCLDVFRPVWKGAEGTIERNFRDSWKFNIAAYRLAKLIGINTVPMSVERTIDGKQCSITWWVDNIWLVEVERRDKGIKPPATDYWVNQLNHVRVFDQLIANADRNQGNLLITPDWTVWMIDHTRAFRTMRTLPKPDTLKRIDIKLLKELKALNTVSLKKAIGAYLRAEEISALLSRRDAVVSHFESEIREKGEESVLTGLPRSTPHVSVP